MTKRTYEVMDMQNQDVRLIVATSAQAARNHAIKDRFAVRVASGLRVGELIGAGSVIETAGSGEENAEAN